MDVLTSSRGARVTSCGGPVPEADLLRRHDQDYAAPAMMTVSIRLYQPRPMDEQRLLCMNQNA